AERKRIEEQKRLEAARIAEEKRRAEEQRLLEEQQRAEWERLQAEEAEAAAQARSRELANKAKIYHDAMQHKIKRNWIEPSSAKPGDSCAVIVHQIPGGEVVNVVIESCTGDTAFRRSVEVAVYKASPLPEPPEPALFLRQVRFNFTPKE
ncbi:MAG TPA: TonB C-terminal domain-containing protein, partial [Gammaproteobacteria bacterium]